MKTRLAFLLLTAAIFSGQVAEASCGSAYCTVNTSRDVFGTSDTAGLQLDLRYEYVHQDRLRSGVDAALPSGEVGEHDEVSTINRNVSMLWDYTTDAGYGISVSMPWVMREHTHLHNDVTGPEREQWSFSEPGDVRVLGRIPLVSDGHHDRAGLLLGSKLPTGSIDQHNSDGEKAERSLQPGSGSSDVLVGGYISHPLADMRSSVYLQALLQRAVASRDGFRPGDKLALDIGYRYAASERLSLLAQLNARQQWHDRGAEAEPAESGGDNLQFSPGISYALTPALQVYGFVQTPLYQHVIGTQLVADRTLMIGISTKVF